MSLKTEIRIKLKSLYAKAVNSGMTPKEATNFFNDVINEKRGILKTKKSIAATTDF